MDQLSARVLLAILPGILAFVAPTTALAGQNNILVIVADDIGVDNIAAYAEGNDLPPTPTLDSLASGGVLFRNAWSNPMCSPTRACIMTGRYGSRTGVGYVVPVSAGLQDIEVTIPEQLDSRASGYAHAATGKWHMSGPAAGFSAPNDAGWSHFSGFVFGLVNYYDWPRTVDGITATSTQYATTQTVDDTLAWVQAQSQPWVCYVGIPSVHEPYHAPPSHLHTQNLAGLQPELNPRPFYKAMVEAMDAEIGRLLSSLGPALANTNIIFIGDNGTPSLVTVPPFVVGQGKGSPFEGALNVPLIVNGPDVDSPGREVDALVSAVDLYGTVMELAGVEVNPLFAGMDTVSLAPYLASSTQVPLRTTVYAELFATNPAIDFSCVRNDQYKLIEVRNGPIITEVMFDLAADPFESTDLLMSPLTAQETTNLAALQQAILDVRVITPGFKEVSVGACVGTRGEPIIRAVGNPVLNGSYNVFVENAPFSTPVVLFLGGSTDYYRFLPLPFSFGPIGGGPNCGWLVSAEFSISLATSPAGVAGITIPMPPQTWLVGGNIYHQWLVLDPGAPNNPLGLVSTKALAVTVGE